MPCQSKIDPHPPAVRPYRKPALVKGPVLTNVTAGKAISGAVTT